MKKYLGVEYIEFTFERISIRNTIKYFGNLVFNTASHFIRTLMPGSKEIEKWLFYRSFSYTPNISYGSLYVFEYSFFIVRINYFK